jgi:hypothetical protein
MPAKKTAAEPAAAASIPELASTPVHEAVEPEVLPEPIVTWQPTHSPDGAPAMRTTTAVGFFILGAIAVAAVALGAIAIDRATRD